MPSPEKGPSTQAATLIFPDATTSTAIHAIPEIAVPTLAITRFNLKMRRATSLPPHGPGPTLMYALPTLKTTSTSVRREPSIRRPLAPALHRSGAIHKRRLTDPKKLKAQFNIPNDMQSRIAAPSRQQRTVPMQIKPRRFSLMEWFDQHFEFVPRPAPRRARTFPAAPSRQKAPTPARRDSSIKKSMGKAWGQVSHLSSSFGNAVVSRIRSQKFSVGNFRTRSDPTDATVPTAIISEDHPQDQVVEVEPAQQ
jgi:hypothetical protein